METRTRAHLNWGDIIERTARAAGLPKAQVGKVLDAFVALAADTISDLGTVRIKRIGSLSAHWHEGRVLRSPKDRRRMFLDGRYRLQFRPAEAVKQGLARRSPQLWKDAGHQAAWRLAETLLSDLELYHPDKVPKTISADTADETVLATCEAAFGVHWRRVVSTWESSTPEEVRGVRNHLAHCARLRWGT